VNKSGLRGGIVSGVIGVPGSRLKKNTSGEIEKRERTQNRNRERRVPPGNLKKNDPTSPKRKAHCKSLGGGVGATERNVVHSGGVGGRGGASSAGALPPY